MLDRHSRLEDTLSISIWLVQFIISFSNINKNLETIMLFNNLPQQYLSQPIQNLLDFNNHIDIEC